MLPHTSCNYEGCPARWRATMVNKLADRNGVNNARAVIWCYGVVRRTLQVISLVRWSRVKNTARWRQLVKSSGGRTPQGHSLSKMESCEEQCQKAPAGDDEWCEEQCKGSYVALWSRVKDIAGGRYLVRSSGVKKAMKAQRPTTAQVTRKAIMTACVSQ